ncbi:hypothetical protein CJJ23_04840 [Mycoplasmopsis agassizii]|uniref:Restriction endonuclease type II NgoFVII C-terminal B3-like DNA-binding domain-containing protein n=1 Tax=Mycoplasmopsis agassizii TaxID=33922 RepID=A0A269THE6_9BACT|nr:restriction endonuclease PLD domain-containing protein [Mycoplasmopsis agassizii]PAK20893.1 hypothetical protein CJJ23_04840 [Mycoplasmopsis agassizii]
MFYTKQDYESRENYKNMLRSFGQISRVFSNSDTPYLPYRAHENIFARYFDVINISRSDNSIDAYDRQSKTGIALKTWVGSNDQKIAEFGKLLKEYKNLSGIELVKKISEYRNIRLRTTKKLYGINKIIYHVVKRVPNYMYIYETMLEEIDIDNLRLIKKNSGDNNTYFSDSKNIYHFSISKNTLYMIFDNLTLLDRIEINIFKDPYNEILKLGQLFETQVDKKNKIEQLCLRLYSWKNGKKFVFPKSGLNQWNASGRKRHPDEIYIPYPVEDKNKNPNFFPSRDQSFNLMLPDGTWISAKVAQQNNKSIMSNPNKMLGNWLLRKVFEIPENTLITYDTLKLLNTDSVIFTKINNNRYKIDFCELGTYEKFYNLD